MKTLIIHAGLHKTGSTLIQSKLMDCRSSLRKLGVEYPIFKNPDGVSESNHSNMFSFAFKSRTELSRLADRLGWDYEQAAESYRKQLQKAMNSKQTLILSGEELASLSLDSLSRLNSMFSEWAVRVLIYVRPAYSYFCSALQETIKNGASELTASKVLVRKESETIAKFQSVFPSLECYSFPDACKNEHGPVGDFFEKIYLPVPSNHSKGNANVGLGNVVTRLCSHLNQHFRKELRSRSRTSNPLFSSRQLAVDESRFVLTPDEFRDYKNHFEQENGLILTLTQLDFTNEIMKGSSVQPLGVRSSLILLCKLAILEKKVRDESLAFLRENRMISKRTEGILPSLIFFLSAIGGRAIYKAMGWSRYKIMLARRSLLSQ